jgi:hypothetical protein
MMLPNWFDMQFASAFEHATAEQAMRAIANNPQIIRAVNGALRVHDAQKPRLSPTRTQVVRRAIAEVLHIA